MAFFEKLKFWGKKETSTAPVVEPSNREIEQMYAPEAIDARIKEVKEKLKEYVKKYDALKLDAQELRENLARIDDLDTMWLYDDDIKEIFEMSDVFLAEVEATLHRAIKESYAVEGWDLGAEIEQKKVLGFLEARTFLFSDAGIDAEGKPTTEAIEKFQALFPDVENVETFVQDMVQRMKGTIRAKIAADIQAEGGEMANFLNTLKVDVAKKYTIKSMAVSLGVFGGTSMAVGAVATTLAVTLPASALVVGSAFLTGTIGSFVIGELGRRGFLKGAGVKKIVEQKREVPTKKDETTTTPDATAGAAATETKKKGKKEPASTQTVEQSVTQFALQQELELYESEQKNPESLIAFLHTVAMAREHKNAPDVGVDTETVHRTRMEQALFDLDQQQASLFEDRSKRKNAKIGKMESAIQVATGGVVRDGVEGNQEKATRNRKQDLLHALTGGTVMAAFAFVGADRLMRAGVVGVASGIGEYKKALKENETRTEHLGMQEYIKNVLSQNPENMQPRDFLGTLYFLRRVKTGSFLPEERAAYTLLFSPSTKRPTDTYFSLMERLHVMEGMFIKEKMHKVFLPQGDRRDIDILNEIPENVHRPTLDQTLTMLADVSPSIRQTGDLKLQMNQRELNKRGKKAALVRGVVYGAVMGTLAYATSGVFEKMHGWLHDGDTQQSTTPERHGDSGTQSVAASREVVAPTNVHDGSGDVDDMVQTGGRSEGVNTPENGSGDGSGVTHVTQTEGSGAHSESGEDRDVQPNTGSNQVPADQSSRAVERTQSPVAPNAESSAGTAVEVRPADSYVDAQGNRLLDTATISDHGGTENGERMRNNVWGTLDRFEDNVGPDGNKLFADHDAFREWRTDQLKALGYEYKDGHWLHPVTVHDGAKIELYVDSSGAPHARLIGDIEGPDRTITVHDHMRAHDVHSATTERVVAELTPEQQQHLAEHKDHIGEHERDVRRLEAEQGITRRELELAVEHRNEDPTGNQNLEERQRLAQRYAELGRQIEGHEQLIDGHTVGFVREQDNLSSNNNRVVEPAVEQTSTWSNTSISNTHAHDSFTSSFGVNSVEREAAQVAPSPVDTHPEVPAVQVQTAQGSVPGILNRPEPVVVAQAAIPSEHLPVSGGSGEAILGQAPDGSGEGSGAEAPVDGSGVSRGEVDSNDTRADISPEVIEKVGGFTLEIPDLLRAIDTSFESADADTSRYVATLGEQMSEYATDVMSRAQDGTLTPDEARLFSESALLNSANSFEKVLDMCIDGVAEKYSGGESELVAHDMELLMTVVDPSYAVEPYSYQAPEGGGHLLICFMGEDETPSVTYLEDMVCENIADSDTQYAPYDVMVRDEDGAVHSLYGVTEDQIPVRYVVGQPNPDVPIPPVYASTAGSGEQVSEGSGTAEDDEGSGEEVLGPDSRLYSDAAGSALERAYSARNPDAIRLNDALARAASANDTARMISIGAEIEQRFGGGQPTVSR